MRTRSCHRQGLTRFEVVVVLFLAVLAFGFFLVYLPRMRANSQRVHCMDNLRRLGEGILHFQESKKTVDLPGGRQGYLPAARIAEGYAAWPVQIAPFVDDASPLKDWDLQKRYQDQAATVREAVWPLVFCPARQRTTRLGGDDEFRGALGDYACVAGNGDPQRLWTGPDANGPMILGLVLEQKDGLILRWRGRTSITDLEKRGLSYTFLLGEKHVPSDRFGQEAAGDGPIYDGAHPANFSRIGGMGFGLAAGPDDPINLNFGSAHEGLCQFLLADGSVRVCSVDMSEDVLAALTTITHGAPPVGFQANRAGSFNARRRRFR